MKIAKFKKTRTWTVLGQVKKIWEEVIELMQECMLLNKQGILSEGLDVVQAVFTLFLLLGYTKKDIEAHMSLHRQKLEIRDHEGKIKIEEWIEV